jgi:hypothetical protein
MNRERWTGGAWLCLVLLCTTHAYAHFKLLKPASWLTEDELGGPQKGSPCGSGNTRPFIGDDVQPTPVSDAVTTFHAGETIKVELQETVYHPGYFRISLAPTSASAATSTDFPDPPLTDLENCHYDNAAVQTRPHDDVLADGIFMAADQNAANRSLMQEVKLPNEPCEHCTLQVVQVMEGHPASSCFYFHCADIEILPADGASAGSGNPASGNAGSPAGGAAGSSGSAASSRDSGGCSVASAGDRSSTAAAWCLLGVASVFCRRRLGKRGQSNSARANGARTSRGA